MKPSVMPYMLLFVVSWLFLFRFGLLVFVFAYVCVASVIGMWAVWHYKGEVNKKAPKDEFGIPTECEKVK